MTGQGRPKRAKVLYIDILVRSTTDSRLSTAGLTRRVNACSMQTQSIISESKFMHRQTA